MQIKDFILQCQQRVDTALEQRLPAANSPASRLCEAIRYGVFNGGKRVRPVLLYATAQTLNCPLQMCDNAACAVELIHAYSLIHDDLPAMDDDDLRRGKPTCHIAFDEATAILAGDAMQAMAFEVLIAETPSPVTSANQLAMVRELAHASGAAGMAAGQAVDLTSTGKILSLQELEHMHRLKTGALISASVMLGALASNRATPEQLNALQTYSAAVGLAFQIKDDILDVEGDTQTLGKPQGSDQALDKATYTSILGLEAARELALTQHHGAVEALLPFGPEADVLRDLSSYIVERNN